MKIVISDLDHADQKEEKEIFGAAGLDFELRQSRTEADVINNCKGAEIVLNQYAPMTRKVLAALKPELKAVVRYGVGLDNIDVAAATDLGIQVCNVPDYGMNEVAEHALALALDLARKITLMNADVHAGNWSYRKAQPAHRLANQTLGILGLGRNGRAFAEKARGIFARVIGYDPYYKTNKADNTDWIEQQGLDEVLANADIIALHMPLTKETAHIINADNLAKMKPGAYLVNTSRGGLVDEKALAAALESGQIAGAALDVAEHEPIAKDSPLLAREDVLITPHIAWYSEEAAQELKRKTAEEAVRFAKGQPLRNPANNPGQH